MAKISGASSATMKVVFQSEIQNSYQGNNKIINQYGSNLHSFTVQQSANSNREFLVFDSGVTFYLDQVEVVEEIQFHF